MPKSPHAVPVKVREVLFFEREVEFRLPFRFGSVTLTATPQAFVRARVALADGREGWGQAAELMVPKWFDKNPVLSAEENIRDLRTALQMTADLYLAESQFQPPFRLHAAGHPELRDSASRKGLNRLVTSFGPALVDRAVLDAACRLRGVSFFEAMKANLPGLGASTLFPDLAGFDFDRFLAGLPPRSRIFARHTVGLVDPLTPAELEDSQRLHDGLPETLEEVLATYGNRYFKLKLGGNVEADSERLEAVARVLERIPEDYFVTLDANEQYREAEDLRELWERVEASPQLARFREAVLFIEQPFDRRVALEPGLLDSAKAFAGEKPLGSAALPRPVIVDESDDDYRAFPRARECGYRGVSSKSCKGFYKSLVNAARCRLWNAEAGRELYFLSAEDLTIQPGVSLHQDLTLIALLGLEHAERNGHHYVAGMVGAPPDERRAYLAAHPDLYVAKAGRTCVRLERGVLAFDSLAVPGFGGLLEPDWTALRPMPDPPAAA